MRSILLYAARAARGLRRLAIILLIAFVGTFPQKRFLPDRFHRQCKDDQNQTEPPNHSAGFGDSIASSPRQGFWYT
jgi:hypothetical protein